VASRATGRSRRRAEGVQALMNRIVSHPLATEKAESLFALGAATRAQRVSLSDERLAHAVVSRRAICSSGGSGGVLDRDDREPDQAAEMTLGVVMNGDVQKCWRR